MFQTLISTGTWPYANGQKEVEKEGVNTEGSATLRAKQIEETRICERLPGQHKGSISNGREIVGRDGVPICEGKSWTVRGGDSTKNLLQVLRKVRL